MIQPFCSSEKINGNKTGSQSLNTSESFCSSEKINGNKTLSFSQNSSTSVLF